MPIIEALIPIAVGALLAFMGKRFVWLLVGGTGFILAYDIVTFLIPGSGMFEIGAALVTGLVAGWLATRFTRILLMAAAFILVGHLGFAVANWFALGAGLSVILWLVCGGIGLAVMRFFAGPSIAILSALGGAALVGNGVAMLLYGDKNGGTWVPALVTLVVALAGLFFQLRGDQTSKVATAQ